MPLSIMFQLFTTPVVQARGLRRLKFYATFNNVSVIYHTCGIGRGFRRLMFFATFSIMFQSFTTRVLQSGLSEGSCVMPLTIFNHLPHLCCSQGVQGSCVLCHFQYFFSHLPHLCCSQCIQESHVLCHFQYSVIYHTITIDRGVQEARVYCHFQ